MSHEPHDGLTRRAVLEVLAVGATVIAGCATARPTDARPSADRVDSNAPSGGPPMTKDSNATIPALAGEHTLVPLPFGAGSLSGLSERMITSHYENNYGGAVKNLNRVERELAEITQDTPPFVVAALRDRELTFRNSKTLHEAYFANLGGDGRRSGAIEAALAKAYGTTARWEQHVKATAMGLGGGSGWAILAFELDTGALRTISSGNHTQVLATSVPLLVLDMYEHAYQIDYGAAAARYIDAFFANVRWDAVNERLARAERIHALFTAKA